MKKLLSFLLVLCLVVGMVPMIALADEGDTAESSNYAPNGYDYVFDADYHAAWADYYKEFGYPPSGWWYPGYYWAVATVNGTPYYDLASALYAAGNTTGNVTVELLQNVTSSVDLTVPANTTLYINSWVTLTGNIINNGIVENYGTIMGNVTGGAYTGTGTITGSYPGYTPPTMATVQFNVTPYWATVTVRDDHFNYYSVGTDNTVTLPVNATYYYEVKADGFITKGDWFTVTDTPITVDLTTDPNYRVYVRQTAYGYVTVDKPNAAAGDWVTLTAYPNKGYSLTGISAATYWGYDVPLYSWSENVYYFQMPEWPVVVDASFGVVPEEYRVYVDPVANGTLKADRDYAKEGEWVYITVTPNNGYKLSGLTVTRPNGYTVKTEYVSANTYRFAMPGVRVTVDAEFERASLPFTDVGTSDWFYDSVFYVYDKGLMDGINSYTFAPGATTTRAMVVQILYRMAGSPRVTTASGFTDVAAGSWYADAVNWAAANGVVNGTGAATFSPNAAVTREQLAAMLYRYANLKGYNTSSGENNNILSYYDVAQVSEYAYSALQWACADGIIDGTGYGYLTPQGQASRAQLAAMLYRFCTAYKL